MTVDLSQANRKPIRAATLSFQLRFLGCFSYSLSLCVLYRTSGEGVRNQVLQKNSSRPIPKREQALIKAREVFHGVPVKSIAFLFIKHLNNLVLIRHPSYTSGTTVPVRVHRLKGESCTHITYKCFQISEGSKGTFTAFNS